MVELSWRRDGDDVVADGPGGSWRITHEEDGWRLIPPGADHPQGALFGELDEAERFAQHRAGGSD